MKRLLQQQDFKTLFDSTLDAILVADDKGVYLAANPAACLLLKTTESAILGRTIGDFTGSQNRDQSQQNWQSFLKQGQASGEIELICADGSRCIAEFRAKANFLPGQHLSVLHDITERKQTEAALLKSNQQTISIMESVSDTVLAFDHNWCFLYANPQSEAILGRPPGEVLGRNLWQEYPKTCGTVFEEAYRRAARENTPVHFQGYNPEMEMWLEVHVYPSDVGVTVYLRDINHRKQAEDNLLFLSEAGAVLSSSLDHDQIIEDLAQLTIRHLADWCAVDILEAGEIKRLAVVHKDAAKIEFAHEFQQFYPPRLEDPTGVPQVMRSGQAQLWDDIPDELLAASAPDARWLEMVRSLGMKSLMIVPLVAGGRTIGAMTLVREKTGRRYCASDLVVAQELGRRAGGAVENGQLFRDRTAALRVAEEAGRARDEFLAVVSHELKTPMTPILGWIGLLKAESRQTDPSVLNHALDVMERSVKAQAQLVEDLLDISRIVTGKLRLEIGTCDLCSVVCFVSETVRPAAQAKGVELLVHFDDGVGPVLGDEDRLQQVVWNLLSNAIKFTPVSGLVVVSLRKSAAGLELTVRDTGQGIRPEFLPYVFDRFRQADSSSTREHGGLGLGLSIVRNVVELHGGTVHVDSPGVGLGATFKVRFPPQLLEDDPYPAPNSLPERAQKPAPSPEEFAPPARPLQNVRILVIEDEQNSREMVATLLKRQGAQVQEAEGASEGLIRLQEWLPDLVLCDIGMPLEDGYRFIERARALPACCGGQTPAIALTAYGRREDRLKALSSGFQNHIVKPANPTELVVTIASLTRRGAR